MLAAEDFWGKIGTPSRDLVQATGPLTMAMGSRQAMKRPECFHCGIRGSSGGFSSQTWDCQLHPPLNPTETAPLAELRRLLSEALHFPELENLKPDMAKNFGLTNGLTNGLTTYWFQ